MRTLLLTLFALANFLAFQRSQAQDSISIKDAGDIRFKAERIVKEFNDLLNVLSNNDIESKEKYELIVNSYSGSANRIFKDSSVLVEDDTNPAFKSAGQSKDESVGNYLKDFDLFYQKSDEPSVELKNVKSSKVKKTDNVYVKVYFNSSFKNKSSNDVSYSVTNRVVEVRVVKEKSKWEVYIGRIGFFNPIDTVGDVANDLPLIPLSSPRNMAATKDSVAAFAEQKSFEDQLTEERRKKEADEESVKRERIRSLLDKGDKALQQNDFTGALKYYSDAKEIDPYDLSVLASISKARNLEQTNTLSSKQMYDKLILKAKLEENNRLYENALSDYKAAFALKPEEEANYAQHIKELTVKFRTLSELEEKYNAGLYKDAIKDYDKAIKKDNKNSDYYLGRGKCYDKIADYSKALKDYSQAYDLDNNNLGALKYRAQLYEKTNEPFKALTDYKTYLTIDKENMEIYEEIAGLHVLLKQRDEAIANLDQALDVNPKAAHIYLTKGLLLLDKNDYANASENFSNTIKIDNTSALAYYNRGKCMLFLNDIEKAAADFNSARNKKLDATNVENIKSFAAGFYQRAAAKFSAGKMDSAIILIDYAILVDPTSSQYEFTRGEYYYTINNNQEAINSYDQAIKIKDNYVEALYKRGLSYYNLTEYQKGIDNFNAVLQQKPQDIMAQKGLGDCSFALGNFARASQAFDYSIKLIGNAKGFNINVEAEVYNMKGRSYFEQANYETALSDFKSAIKAKKDFPDAYFNRGYTYFKTNHPSDAIEDINTALNSEHGHFQWDYVLGQAYEAKKEYASAAQAFGNCIKSDSLHRMPDAMYHEGYCYYQSQNYAKALDDYSRTILLKLDTSIASFNTEFGNIYLSLGKYDSALSYFYKSYAKNPNDGLCTYGIATAILSQGKTDESLAWFEKSFKTKAVKYSDIKKDKLIAAVRDDKRFKDLLKQYY